MSGSSIKVMLEPKPAELFAEMTIQLEPVWVSADPIPVSIEPTPPPEPEPEPPTGGKKGNGWGKGGKKRNK